VGEPLDLVHVIGGHQFARAILLEIAQRKDIVQIPGLKIVIQRPAFIVHRERGMRLIADAGLDAYHVFTIGDEPGIGPLGQPAPFAVKQGRARHLHRAKRNQLVRALEIMVLQRRLVNLRQKYIFVLAVGLHRIEVLGALGKRRVENIGARFGGRIRIIPWRTVAPGQERNHQQRRAKQK